MAEHQALTDRVPTRSPAPAGNSLAGSAYQQIKADIVACRLPPGEMVGAAQLAEHFEMSRTPVHEALKALCAEGLLRVMPRVGYVVTPVARGDTEEIFDLRLSLEVLGAGLAAERAEERDLTILRGRQERALENLGAGARDDPAYLESVIAGNRDFHLSVAALSGNQRLARMVAGLLDEGQRIYFLYYRSGRPPTAGDPHEAIFHALATKDPEAARRAMAAHIREMRDGTMQRATAARQPRSHVI